MSPKAKTKFKKSYQEIMIPLIGKERVNWGLFILLSSHRNYRLYKGVCDALRHRLNSWLVRSPFDTDSKEHQEFIKIHRELMKKLDRLETKEITP